MSIRLRLALWYLFLICLALLGFSLLAYHLSSDHLDAMVDDAINRQTRHIIDTLQAFDRELFTRAEGAHAHLEIRNTGRQLTLLALEHPGVYTNLYSTEGEPLYPRHDTDPVIPIPAWALEAAAAGEASRYDTTTDAGEKLRVGLQPLPDGLILQVAADFCEANHLLTRLRVILFSVSLLILVVTFLVAYTVSGQALRPIADIIDTARAIALARSFDKRVEGMETPDELGRLVATLNQMLSSLEETYRSQQRFVADASHELRAPLASIQGNLELLSRQPALPASERTEIMGDIRSEIGRMSRLVADLLSLARADSGQPLNLTEVELDRLVMEVFRSTRLMAQGRLSVEMNKLEPIRLQGDRDRLKQLLLILTDNAVRYTPAQGRVVFALTASDRWAVLTISDTGIGIDPADLPHIFDRFYRTDKARSRKEGGTGLGLNIARWIAEAHGGRIEVRSKLGEGSRFIVYLPRLVA